MQDFIDVRRLLQLIQLHDGGVEGIVVAHQGPIDRAEQLVVEMCIRDSLTTAADNMYLSSSLVKQVAGLGGDISEFVPACIVPDIMKKIGRDEENDR